MNMNSFVYAFVEGEHRIQAAQNKNKNPKAISNAIHEIRIRLVDVCATANVCVFRSRSLCMCEAIYAVRVLLDWNVLRRKKVTYELTNTLIELACQRASMSWHTTYTYLLHTHTNTIYESKHMRAHLCSNPLVRMCDHVDRFAITFDRRVCRIHTREEDELLLKVQLAIICSAHLTRSVDMIFALNCCLSRCAIYLMTFRFFSGSDRMSTHRHTLIAQTCTSQFITTLSVSTAVCCCRFVFFYTLSIFEWLVSQQMRQLTY